MAKETKAQQETVARVMHEFKHGELERGHGGKVRNAKQAIAIALSEAGASNQQSPKENRRRLAEKGEGARGRARQQCYSDAALRGSGAQGRQGSLTHEQGGAGEGAAGLMVRTRGMRLSRLSPLLVLALAACAASHPTHPPGRWVGRVGDPCPGTALLDSRHGEAVFVRDDGAQVLRGTITLDGQVSTRVETPGVNKKGFVQTFTGQVKGGDASGTYTSPRCTAPVTMHAG